MRKFWMTLVAALTLSLTGCGYNTLQSNDEQIKSSWSEVINQYNVTVRSFPSNLTAMAFGFSVKPNFTVENEKAISTAPKVDFGSAPAASESKTQGAAK